MYSDVSVSLFLLLLECGSFSPATPESKESLLQYLSSVFHVPGGALFTSLRKRSLNSAFFKINWSVFKLIFSRPLKTTWKWQHHSHTKRPLCDSWSHHTNPLLPFYSLYQTTTASFSGGRKRRQTWRQEQWYQPTLTKLRKIVRQLIRILICCCTWPVTPT